MFKILLFVINFYMNNGGVRKFPDKFKFGVSTAAYQIEGGWNVSGKSENIWDHLTHMQPELIRDHSTGDVACDSYNRWQEDIQILKELGVDYYRFSLSWTRILPTGFPNRINADGVTYYCNLIDALLAANIQPVVTIYHWDLPQSIQLLGGWLNGETSNYLVDFAQIVFQIFGNRVKLWITINEPSSICVETYSSGDGAPNIKDSGRAEYLCGKNILLAHAAIYRLYQKKFARDQKGKIGITIDSIWAEPLTNTSRNVAAADREMEMSTGWFTHSILSKVGNYPEVMRSRIENISKEEGFLRSRLPPLSPLQIRHIRGSYDFLGLNHYHTWLVSDAEAPIDEPTSHRKDKGTKLTQDPNWKPTPQIVAWGLKKLLNWIRNSYGNPSVIITENGLGLDQHLDGLNDTLRVTYLKEFLNTVLAAIHEDGCKVFGYIHWSLMDNMEWRQGYTMKYGLYHVDFNNANRTRTGKLSSNYYKRIIATHQIPEYT